MEASVTEHQTSQINQENLLKFENERLKKDNAELKEMLRKKFEQELENNSKCNGLQCEVENLKKAQIEIKKNLKGEYEHKIETLEKDIEELKEKLQTQIEENLNRAAEINTNDFIFENEQIVK